MSEWLRRFFRTRREYARPYCRSCKLIWGRASIGRLFTCTKCSRPLTLKSFNPWLKAAGGLCVIAGTAGTLLIPNVPVIWIGGFIWGGSLIVNGFRQWFKVRSLDRSDDVELEIVDEIVSCPHCGTGNRIRSHSSRMRPVCGKCRQPLPERRTAGTSLPTFLTILRNHKKAVVGTAAAAVLLAIIIRANMNTPRQPPPVVQTPATYMPPPRVPAKKDVFDLIQPADSKPAKVEDDETLPARSLPTGTILTTGYLNGHGKLTLDNGTGADAFVTVINTANDRAIASFYVRSGQNTTLAGVPNGDFSVMYALGRDWDSATQSFTRSRSFGRYDKSMSFTTETRVEGDYISEYYDTVTLTLHKVPGGNLTTSRISENEFKKYLTQTGAIRP